jgi:DNA repair exonuclease SbcCD nuclease subunit
MSKVAILNDSHFGYKNSSELFLDYQRDFYHKVFFPYCEKHGITRILHLGDIFDNRKHISIKALNFVRTQFLEEIRARGMHMDIIPGNHDTAYKNTIDLSSMFEILRYYDDCTSVHMKPTIVSIDGLKIGMVPWIAADNRDECLDFIETSQADILGGHFQIGGFKLIANSSIKAEGLSKKVFSRYDMVLSGHFHTKSSQNNIIYLGSQYQFNWSDVDDNKYFHVLDTKTRDLDPILNPDKIYTKYYYDETDIADISEYLRKQKFAKSKIEGKYVRVVVKKKTNLYNFDLFIQHIKDRAPHDLTIIENFEEMNPGEITDDESATIEDTTTLLNNYIDDHLLTHLNKDRLKNKLHELYIEASIEGTV